MRRWLSNVSFSVVAVGVLLAAAQPASAVAPPNPGPDWQLISTDPPLHTWYPNGLATAKLAKSAGMGRPGAFSGGITRGRSSAQSLMVAHGLAQSESAVGGGGLGSLTESELIHALNKTSKSNWTFSGWGKCRGKHVSCVVPAKAYAKGFFFSGPLDFTWKQTSFKDSQHFIVTMTTANTVSDQRNGTTGYLNATFTYPGGFSAQYMVAPFKRYFKSYINRYMGKPDGTAWRAR